MTRSLRPSVGTAPVAVFAAAALAALALLAVPRAATARCVQPTPIEEAVRTSDVVIVGTVVAVAEEGTRAAVKVEEIWRGSAIEAEVTVWGGPGGRTSVDRTFVAGARYLFTLILGEGGRLTDSLCSSTVEWDEHLAALRPLNAMQPQPAGDDAAQPTAGEAAAFDPGALMAPAGVALAVAIALLAAGLLARGRQAKG
jgi:hypothetical protein